MYITFPQLNLLMSATVLCGPFFSLALPVSASANEAVISLTVENDALVNSDRYYTNGVRLEYAREETDGFIPQLLQKAFGAPRDTPVLQSFALGQSIFTPEDILTPEPLPEQRPYAGFIFADLTANIAADNGTHWFLAQVGLVGPAALGEDIQNWWHSDIIDRPEAQGWDNQIDNEVGFVLAYDRQFTPYVISKSERYGIDLTPHAGLALGTLHTDARAGATLRMGSGLDNDIGPPRIKPAIGGSGYFHRSEGLDMHLFAGVETRLVAHDIFLDGSLIRDTEITVESKPLVSDLQAGAVLQYRNIQLSFAYVYRTREYRGQSDPQKFTTFAISRRF